MQDELDLDQQRCDFLDVLEEAVLLRRKVRVRTKDDRAFEDFVVDVPTEDGRDYVVFAARGKMLVDDLRAVLRSDDPALA